MSNAITGIENTYIDDAAILLKDIIQNRCQVRLEADSVAGLSVEFPVLDVLMLRIPRLQLGLDERSIDVRVASPLPQLAGRLGRVLPELLVGLGFELVGPHLVGRVPIKDFPNSASKG